MDKALAILDAGWELFLERGVEATPIEAIATKAGVSKVTVYTHYPDKTALFRAAVEREMLRIEASQRSQGGGGKTDTIAEQLYRFGLGIMTFLASKPAIDFYSVVAGELRRHEDLARAFYDFGPGRTRQNLARLISAAIARGELFSVDAEQAADALFGMWQGFTNFQMSLGIDVDTIRRELPERVERAVGLFLRIYGRSDAGRRRARGAKPMSD